VFELWETVETVVAERLPLIIQLRWMETVKRFLEKSAQKVAIILSTFTGEAMKSAAP
jgi:hypothetical protein